MLLAPEKKYIPRLRELWHNVFGDEYGYIDLFFDSVYFKSKIFAHFESDKIVSVFYLLDCKIRFENAMYDGYYLYAAATDPDFRKKGLMGSLIREGQVFAEKELKDFISLVPGNSQLYDYYAKFGFQSAMYKCVDEAERKNSEVFASEPADLEEYLKERFSLTSNAFLWEKDELQYVFDCFLYYDVFCKKSSDCFFIEDENDGVIKELLFANNKENGLSDIFSLFPEKTIIHSQYGKNKIPFGMILPINEKLKRQWSPSDIYMNLALD